MLRRSILFTFVAFAWCSNIYGEPWDTPDFRIVHKEMLRLVKTHGKNQVLVVLDVDNTLLAMNQALGSDQWFSWQEDLLKKAPKSPQLVAPDFEGLLQVQWTLHALGGMHPPEPKLPSLLAELQSKGCTFVILTSRSPETRASTLRELRKNNYEIMQSALTIDEKQRGEFLPDQFQPCNKDRVVSQTLLKQLKALKPRNVSYSEGLYLTAGQHKGWMLRALLARTDQQFKAIVFVDDKLKHCQRVEQAFQGQKEQVLTFRYGREDGNVAAFHQSSKQHVIRQWKKLNKAINTTLAK